MDELSSPAAVIEITNAASRVRKSLWDGFWMLSALWLAPIVLTLVSISSLHAQLGSPARLVTAPKGIFTPKPEYRSEWAKRGLTGKGIVLVTIDKQTGKVTGAQMLQSTGNRQLDGSALEAYSQWRFDPRTVTVSQLKIPIEFANRPKPPTASRTPLKPAILYPLLILFGFAVAVMAMRARRKG